MPEIDGINEEDELPFKALSNKNRLIMFAHIKIKGYGISTFSKSLVERVKSFHKGLTISDDLGMKALGNLSLKEKLEKTLTAGFGLAIVTDMITGFREGAII